MQKEYMPVNWVDGMKINKNHFIEQQQAGLFQQAVAMRSFLNNHNYGLLPAADVTRAGVKIWLNIDNQQHVHARIMECNAITRGGYSIALNNDTSLESHELNARVPGLSLPFSDLSGKQSAYYVVLAMDPFKRVPAGAANPEEVPFRLPYTAPAYKLLLLPEEETSINTLGDFQLPVGKLLVEDQRVFLDEQYIPPCAAVNSHRALLELHAELEQFFARMELNAVQIIQKIFQKKQQNDLSLQVQQICEKMLVYMAPVYTQLRLAGLYTPPVELISAASGLARLFKNTLDLFMGTGKEELINYFTEWCGISQGELEDVITSFCNHQYDHLDIGQALEKATRFTQVALRLFNSLAALDYIGKKKEAGIFVKEQLMVPEEETVVRKRRSFLAD